MRELLKKPYDLLERKSFRCWFLSGLALFTLIFLWIFEPYGLYNLSSSGGKILAIGLYVGVALLLLIFQFFVLQNILIKKYTLGLTIVWILLSFFIIGISSAVINSFLYNQGRFFLNGFIFFQGAILSISIIPVTIFVLIHYNMTLKKRLRVALQINQSIPNKNQHPDNGQIMILNSENKHEKMELPVSSLFYITSVDNYIDIVYADNKSIKHQLLRYSLSGVEQDNVAVNALFRCHKSYLVNKTKIASVTGNAAGYKLKLMECADEIPVSRKWNGEIKNICALS